MKNTISILNEKMRHNNLKQDKARSIREDNFMSTSFDLQSVLQLPCTMASHMHYSRKLDVDNCVSIMLHLQMLDFAIVG